MVLKWEGEIPPDEREWLDVLLEALGEQAGFCWVRFYQGPEGWRFDIEQRCEERGPEGSSYRRVDESVALRVYTMLVESGKPLDPGWVPFAPSHPAATGRPPAPVVPRAAPPVAEAAALGEAPPPQSESDVAPGRRRDRPKDRSPKPPAPVRDTKTESDGVTLTAPGLGVEPPSEPASPAPRLSGWRGLRPAIVYLPAVLLVAFGGWLFRDGLRSRPSAPPPPSPSAPVSREAAAGDERLKEPEAVVAQPEQERAQMPSGRRPAAPAPIGATQQASSRPPVQPVDERADEILASTPVPGPTPTPVATPAAADPAPADVPLPTDLPVSTDAAVSTAPEPAAVAEPPPTPPPVQRGAMVDLNDPDLTRPVLVTQPRPRYPPLALERRLSGTVRLNALVDETGAVVEVSVVQASLRGVDFEGAATRHVLSRVYRPATKQGVPVRVWMPIVVEFRLSGR